MIETIVKASIDVKQRLLDDNQCKERILALIDDSVEALKNGGKIILAGNGGSFADAQHISAEFTSRFLFDREALPSVALGCNGSSISAIGNDYGYDQVFARELSAIGQKEDIFIPISTSGSSKNILNVIDVANKKAIKTYGFTGNQTSLMSDMCSCIHVPSSETPRIQECHILIGHIVCEAVEKLIFNS